MQLFKKHPFNAEMPDRFDRWVNNVLCTLLEYRDIVKTDTDGKPSLYLRRFYLWRGSKLKLFVHNIRRPDDDRVPHSHPWPFTSRILRGGYTEGIINSDRETLPIQDNGWTWLWDDIQYRCMGDKFSVPARHTHMIRKVYEPSAWTLVSVGPYERVWDFLTPEGRVDFRTYLYGDANADVTSEYEEDNPTPKD